MSLAMATRALDRLPAEGLRVLAAREPERVRLIDAQAEVDAVSRAVEAALEDLLTTGRAAGG